MNRFQIHEGQPPLLPGSCVICGTSKDATSYIDFGVQVKKYGRIYFCSTCFGECAKTVGYVPVSKYKDQLDISNGYHSRIRELEEENDGLDYRINSLRNELRIPVLDNQGEPEPVKRPVGRPKGAKQGTAKQDPS